MTVELIDGVEVITADEGSYVTNGEVYASQTLLIDENGTLWVEVVAEDLSPSIEQYDSFNVPEP